ncbi:MAG: hypothetical protein K0R61_2459 [Microvirga sp.]|jgi:hypothetical protein|nr:hypothetical protein [Microvirga sp.]
MRNSTCSLLATAALSLASADIRPAAADASQHSSSRFAQPAQSGEVGTSYAQFRRFGPRYGYGPRYYGRPYAGRYYRRGGGAAAAGLIGGLAAGALIGGAIASQQAQAVPVPVAPADDAVAYCMQRFRSYDPSSGTYLGFDGMRHPCP